MSGKQTQSLLFEGIQLLQDISLILTAVITDQGSNNINLSQTRTRFHVNADKPYFVHHEKKIYMTYDLPHLIKNICINLKNHGFEFGENSAEWCHISQFYYKDVSKPTRMAPKLTVEAPGTICSVHNGF